MSKKYSDEIQEILNKWSEELQKLSQEGKINPRLVENIQDLIENGNIADAKQIRFAIESGVKNVGTN